MAVTKRDVSKGGEKWLGKKIEVLDHGFVYLVDYMGSDAAVEQAARVSYGKGTRSVSETRGLIRYLRRHRHTTPFEMVEFKFHVKMPLFVARQWVRHRTASINEESGRYSVMSSEFYVPPFDKVSVQSVSNKQGRGEAMERKAAAKIRKLLVADSSLVYSHYEQNVELALAKELARVGLTLNYYTQLYWKIDLHNLMHFLKLRLDSHAQWEIRQYAEAMVKIVAETVPMCWEAFVDYELECEVLSRAEKRLLGQCIDTKKLEEKVGASGLSKREAAELDEKIRRMV